MNRIKELREKRAKAWEEAKSFLEERQANTENGVLSAEDNEMYELMEKEVVDLGREIDRLERQSQMDRELEAATSAPLTSKPGKDAQLKTGRAADAYRSAFWSTMRNKYGSAVHNDALSVGEDSEGGYLVPDEYEATLVKALQDINALRGLCHVIQTSHGERKIPVVASHGTASWLEEEGGFTESPDSFTQVSLAAYKLGTLLKVSDELLNDSLFDLESYIAGEFARRIGAAEEEAFVTGDGSNKPTGILHDSLGAELGVTAASTGAIAFDEIFDLYHSLRAPYRQQASFLVNDATVKAIRKLKDGQGQYIWQPSVTAGQPDTLLNRPLYTSQFMPTIGADEKTVAFGDFSYYWIADRSGRVFKRLNELYAANGQVGFMAYQRLDAKLVLQEAVKVLCQKA